MPLFCTKKVTWKIPKLKSKLDFEIEAPFGNRSSILKSKLHLEIEAPFWNWSSISKSKLHLGIEARFWNRSSISKWKFYFQIKAPFENRSSILKPKLHFEIEVRFWNLSSISKWKPQKCSVCLSYVSVMEQTEHRSKRPPHSLTSHLYIFSSAPQISGLVKGNCLISINQSFQKVFSVVLNCLLKEAVVQRCSVKKVFLEISQNSQENNCAIVSFLIKLQACKNTFF